jgi:hypothetical protein
MRAPIDGIPYKVYATESGIARVPVAELIAWTPVARSGRFLLTSIGAGLVGALFRRSIARRSGLWLGLWVGFWVVGYVRYFARLRRDYG